MNLIEEIKKNTTLDMGGEPVINANGVATIVTEMCKRQRELCEKEYKRREAEYFEIGYDIELSSTGFSHEILNAPLATEEE